MPTRAPSPPPASGRSADVPAARSKSHKPLYGKAIEPDPSQLKARRQRGGRRRRGISIAGQRFITTLRPAASARAAAASSRTSSCIHTTLAPIAIASSTTAPAARCGGTRRPCRPAPGCRRARHGILAVDRLAGGGGVDRDRAVAVALQIGHDPVARPIRPRAGADYRDRAHAGQDVAQIGVGIISW